MRLTALEAQDFRNIANLKLEFDPNKRGIIFTGQNGSGKTNILEAVVTALRGTPHRNIKTGDLLRHGTNLAQLGLRLKSDSEEGHFIGYRLQGKIRQMKLDGADLPSRLQLVRTLPLVSFFPDELEAMRGEPALRRAILDRAFGITENFVKSWLTYNKLLKSRNLILKERGQEALLMVYSQQLARQGEELHQLRVQFLDQLNNHFIAACQRLGFEYPVALQLKPGFHPGELATQLVNNFDRERELCRTLQGPHLADLEILVAGEPSRHLASQGQQRLLFIGLKLAILSFYRENLQEQPLLLLDDISSELGSKYISAIYQAIPAGTQLLLSTISPTLLPFPLEDMQQIEVNNSLLGL